MINNYSFEDVDRPEDQQKGRVGAGIFLVIVIIALVWPWFSTEYPIPEAEGLMASFGNVEVAGGGAENVSDEVTEEAQPDPQEEVQEETTQEVEEVEEIEEVETSEMDDAPPVKTTPDVKPNTTKSDNSSTKSNNAPQDNTPKVNSNALFGGGGGTGTGSGAGQQGVPDGKGNLGGTGRGDKGNGDGAIGNRPNIRKCDDYKASNNSGWSEAGRIVVRICVNAAGNVVSAEQVIKKSTTINSRMVNLALGCAKEYKYEPKPGAANACGEITITFGLE